MSAQPDRARVDAVLAEALELPADERASFLDRACGEEAGLRTDVEELLGLASAEDARPTSVLDGPLWRAWARDLDPPTEAVLGTRVGAWRLVRELGRGGMGAVFLAERADGAFVLTAALKLLRTGTDSDELLARFEREKQILARLQHPNVARLLDGGADDGRPFLVMEYVEGRALIAHCDEQRLGIDERLALFLDVGRAVQHAHRNLVVHRDLKPSNIVVTADGGVKLLDFGIAKVLDPDGGPDEPRTRTMARLLTPEYASPEQVLGQPITTASDVYQLGLLLYELLTGRRAHRIEEPTPTAMQEAVCERQPVRPSAVATAPLSRKLRGDLDNIALMALRKEPERRYASVDQMMEDVERHRRGLPVRAGRDTLGYRASKFVRRHSAGVASAAGFALLLVGYAATVTHQARERARERDRAQLEALKTARVRDFLVGLFEAADPYRTKGEQVTAAELVDAGARQARERLAAEPEVQAEMLGVLGAALQARVSYDRAEALLAEALAIQRRLHEDDHPDLARALDDYAGIVNDKGHYAEAERLAREALAMRQRLAGTPGVEVAHGLERVAIAISLQGRYAEAERLLRDALAIRQGLSGAQDSAIGEIWNHLGVQLGRQWRHEEAETAHRTALAIKRRVYPPDHPAIGTSLNSLAGALGNLGRYEEAEALFRETLQTRRRVFGDEHPLVANVIHNIGEIQRRRGQPDEAAVSHREALAIRRKVFGARQGTVAMSLHSLAWAMRDGGHVAEAEALFREALPMFREARHWGVGMCALSLGHLLVSAGRPAEAEPLLSEALAIRVASDGDASAAADEARLGLGLCRAAQGREDEARALLAPALERLRDKPEVEPRLIADAQTSLGRLARTAPSGTASARDGARPH